MKLIKDGSVDSNLLKLAWLLGFRSYMDSTPAELNAVLQEEWFQQGKLRAEIKGRPATAEELELLKLLGCVDSIRIKPNVNYAGGLVFGGMMKAVNRRVGYLIKEAQLGFLIPKLLWFLAGTRPLNPEQEGPKSVPGIMAETESMLGEAWCLAKWPTNETEVTEFVITFSGLGMITRPKVLHTVAYVDVKPPVNTNEPRRLRNPNTEDTIGRWLVESPSNGLYLLVSSQPWCWNQLQQAERVVKKAGRTGIKFDVCGPAAPPTIKLEQYLDDLSRRLKEELMVLG
ncbi:MAG TPA: hypothetical protein VJI33_02775 [Candidatus Paceibacterota bacterium]